MKTRMTKVCVAIITAGMLIAPIARLHAQTDSSAVPQINSPQGGGEKFLLAGEVSTLWQSNQIKGLPSTNSFGADPLGLMLMPLVKITDKLFLDVQVAVTANPGPGGGAGASLNEAIIYYRLAPDVSVFAGSFPPRWGLYEGILDDFTNRYCSSPVGMGLGAQTESGIGIQGGLQVGYSKIGYQLYVANGPQLIVDSTGAKNGTLNYGNYTDNNTNKAIGGSIAFLPFSNSSLELGISGQYTPKAGDAGTAFENINTTSWAADINYYHVFSPVMVRLQGQYEYTQVQNYNLYTDATDATLLLPQFDNKMSGWYCGATVRLSGSQSPFLSNLELGGRLGALTLPENTLWSAPTLNQTTICLTYWFSWKTPINIAYDIYTQAGMPDQSTITIRGMWFF